MVHFPLDTQCIGVNDEMKQQFASVNQTVGKPVLNTMSSYGSDTLKTIENGVVPETRMKDADTVQSFCRRLIDNDDKRSFKRSRVNGLVDGNPPYRLSKLKEAARADACNVNWGIARAYMEAGVGAFYDLFSEAPGYFSIITSHGDDEHRDEYGRILSEEADKVIVKDAVIDYNMQRSQDQMVLHGCGPLMFENTQDVLPRAVNTGDLKVPEFTKSDTHYWEVCMLQIDYYPPELYAFIKDSEAATAVGWDVEYTKNVISNAMDVKTQPGIRYEWEFYQQELKNNSLAYYDDSKINRLAHVFWKEFDGRITPRRHRGTWTTRFRPRTNGAGMTPRLTPASNSYFVPLDVTPRGTNVCIRCISTEATADTITLSLVWV